LRTIDPDISGRFIDLIFDEIKRGDLDKCMDDTRRFRADLQSVPGMGPPAIERFREAHGFSFMDRGG
jgi:hypothetical protein